MWYPTSWIAHSMSTLFNIQSNQYYLSWWSDSYFICVLHQIVSCDVGHHDSISRFDHFIYWVHKFILLHTVVVHTSYDSYLNRDRVILLGVTWHIGSLCIIVWLIITCCCIDPSPESTPLKNRPHACPCMCHVRDSATFEQPCHIQTATATFEFFFSLFS